MVLSDRTGMKGVQVDGTTTSISGKEFREGGMKIVGDEGGNDVLVTIRDDKKVMRTNGVEVVLPARAREHAWLRTCGARSASLCISIHRLSFQYFDFSLLVQNHSHGRDRGRRMQGDVFNKSWYDGGGVGRVGRRGDWGRDRHAVVKVRGRNGKWLGTGNRGAVWVVRVNVLFELCPWV